MVIIKPPLGHHWIIISADGALLSWIEANCCRPSLVGTVGMVGLCRDDLEWLLTIWGGDD